MCVCLLSWLLLLMPLFWLAYLGGLKPASLSLSLSHSTQPQTSALTFFGSASKKKEREEVAKRGEDDEKLVFMSKFLTLFGIQTLTVSPSPSSSSSPFIFLFIALKGDVDRLSEDFSFHFLVVLLLLCCSCCHIAGSPLTRV